jgi:U3 small nucleolar RNA-associated protein 21
LSYSTTRSKDWDDILTAHSDETSARTWSMLNKRLGQHAFGITEKAKTRTQGVIKASPVLTLFPQTCLIQW